MSALLVGLGNPDRGDDAIGPVVARAVRELGLPGVRVLEHEDPVGLIELWTGHDVAVVVDAVRSGRQVGTVHRLETGAGRAPLPPSAWGGTGREGTHAFGVAAVVELARALHRLPARLVVVGVEAGGFDHGAPLTPAVADAVAGAVAVVRSALAADEAARARPGPARAGPG